MAEAPHGRPVDSSGRVIEPGATVSLLCFGSSPAYHFRGVVVSAPAGGPIVLRSLASSSSTRSASGSRVVPASSAPALLTIIAPEGNSSYPPPVPADAAPFRDLDGVDISIGDRLAVRTAARGGVYWFPGTAEREVDTGDLRVLLDACLRGGANYPVSRVFLSRDECAADCALLFRCPRGCDFEGDCDELGAHTACPASPSTPPTVSSAISPEDAMALDRAPHSSPSSADTLSPDLLAGTAGTGAPCDADSAAPHPGSPTAVTSVPEPLLALPAPQRAPLPPRASVLTLRARHVRRARGRRRKRAAANTALALAAAHPPCIVARPHSNRLDGRPRRSDFATDEYIVWDLFAGSKSFALAAGRTSGTYCLTVDLDPTFSPDVIVNFGVWDWASYMVDHYSFLSPSGEVRCWLPLHLHFSPCCLTLSTGAAFFSGRTEGGPWCDGEALSEGYDADRCVHAIVSMLTILHAVGWVGTVTIENPAGSQLWAMLAPLLLGPLQLDLVSCHYCMYGRSIPKATSIAMSPGLDSSFALHCDFKSGLCGAMRLDGHGNAVHRSAGSYGPADSPLPTGLVDGMNGAWRRLHCPRRLHDSLYGSIPIELAESMVTMLHARPVYQRPRRPVPLTFARVNEDGTAHETTESGSDTGSLTDSETEGSGAETEGDNCNSTATSPAQSASSTESQPDDPLLDLCANCRHRLQAGFASDVSDPPPVSPQSPPASPGVVACGIDTCVHPHSDGMHIGCIPVCALHFEAHFGRC